MPSASVYGECVVDRPTGCGDRDERRLWMDALYRNHNQVLRKFLASRRLKPDVVADIVQEAYFRMHTAENLDVIRNPRAFLFRVANNVRLDGQKMRSSRIHEDAVDIDSVDIESEEPGPYRSLQGEQELAIIRAALAELAPKCREAFIMNRLENMNCREIAVELELSTSMIEKLVRHASSRLRARLSEDRASQRKRTVRSAL